MRKQFRAFDRRGVAMLLVMISLVTATILATAYLASRDNSGTIGENVANSTAARCAADTGLQIAIASLQTQKDWRTAAAMDSGRFLRDYPIDNATVSVVLTDFVSKMPPTPNTEYLTVTATGVVNGVSQTATAWAYVPLNSGVDVDLSEFAVFAKDSLSMSEQSIIARWPKAPLSALGERIAIGTDATSASSISLSNSAAAIDAVAYVAPGASSSLISSAASPPIDTIALSDPIPFPTPTASGESESLLSLLDLVMNGGLTSILSNLHYRNIEIKNNAVRTLKGNVIEIADRDYKINSGGKVVIDGNVKMVVFGDLIMDQGAIELKSGARLRLYVRGNGGSDAMQVKDSYIGDVRSNSLRDNTGQANWMDPQRVTIMSMAPSSGSYGWLIESNSVIKGSLYAPHATKVVLKDTSAVYGRVAANIFEMHNDAALFYDPALNSRTGYTNLDSKIYDDNGQMLPVFKTLASLDAAVLQTVADLTSVIIKSDTGIRSILSPSGAAAVAADATPADEPTPRPIQVEYDVQVFGSNVSTWENQS